MSPREQLDEIVRLTVVVSLHGEPTTTDYYEALNRRNELVRELHESIGDAALNHAYAEGRKDQAEEDGFTDGVRAAASMLDKMAEDYATQHGTVDRDAGVGFFKRSEHENHHALLCQLADAVRSIVFPSA